jgi:hypothetical protein
VEGDDVSGLIHGCMRSMEYCFDAEAKLQHMARRLAGRLA